MSAGKYKSVVTIQSKSESTDTYGGTVYNWNDFATVRAKVRPLRGRELVAAQAVQSETQVMFYVRYIPGVETYMRIVCDGKFYDITAIVDVDYQHRELEISAKTGTSEG